MSQIIQLSNRDIAIRSLRTAFNDFLCNYTDEDVKDVEIEIEYLNEVGVDPESEIKLFCFKDESIPSRGPLWSFLGFIHDGYGEYIFGAPGKSEDLWSLISDNICSAFDKIQRKAINHAAKIVNSIIEKRISECSGITEEEKNVRNDLVNSIERYQTECAKKDQDDIRSAIEETMKIKSGSGDKVL